MPASLSVGRALRWLLAFVCIALLGLAAPACDTQDAPGGGNDGGGNDDGGNDDDDDDIVPPDPTDFDGNILIPELRTGQSFTLTAGPDFHDFGTGDGPIATASYDDHGVLGPTFVLTRGETVTFTVTNNLSDPTTVHWHGLHVPAPMDGGPHMPIAPGGTFTVSFDILNEAATCWYHPHPHGMTAPQVRAGLGGFLIVRDAAEAALPLPRTYGVDDLVLALQDKRIVDGELNRAALGNTMTVNGAAGAFREVPAQVVRLRLLNASLERNYFLGFADGRPFHVIAGDNGLLAAPVTTTRLALGPAERAEVLVDLAGAQGTAVQLRNFAAEMTTLGLTGGANMPDGPFDPFGGENADLLRLDVVEPTANAVRDIPAALVPRAVPWSEGEASMTRTIRFTGGTPGNPWSLDDLPFDMNRVDQVVALGAIEIWELVNETAVNHVFHIHAVSFYVLERNGVPDDGVASWSSGRAVEAGPKDSVLVNVGETVRVIMQFGPYGDATMPYMYHCHMLPHEDGGMMANFVVVP